MPSHDVVVKLALEIDTYEYAFEELNLSFIPKKVKLTRISVISNLAIIELAEADLPNIFSIYMNPIIDPICEAVINGVGYSVECTDEFICSNIGTTTTFKVFGLFRSPLETIGSNTEAAVALHLKFIA